MALTDSLVSYWKLDESSGNATDSHGSNTLTNNNTAPYVAGHINNGVDLERDSSQYMSITNAAQSGLGVTGDLSVSMWVKVESNPGTDQQYTLVSKMSTGPSNGYFMVYYEKSAAFYLQGEFYNGGDRTSFEKSNTLTAGTFFHVVYTYTVATPTIKIYVNNTDIAATSLATAATAIGGNTADFTVGTASFDTTRLFDGIIDEVGFWSRALTASEVTSLYNGGAGLAYPFTTASNPSRMMRGIGA